MRSIESEGDTIDEAIENALATLQIARDRVEIEILGDASRGLFGFGGKKARVRATVRPPLASSLDEVGPATDALRVDSGQRVASPESGLRPTGARDIVHAASDGRASADGDPGLRAKPILEELLRHLGVDCRVDLEPGGDFAGSVLQVTGDGSGLVIGRRGQTLDALDYLVNRIASRGDEGVGRVMIDVEHYRDRRKAYLEQLAYRLAAKVKQTGRPVTLNPMSPRDRRIVHLALQNDGRVDTHSFGDGLYRKMTILPAGGGQGRPARDRSS